MKKTTIVTLVSIITAGFGSYMVIAEGQEPEIEMERIMEEGIREQESSNYLSFTGPITAIEGDSNLSSLHVKNEESNHMIFPITEEVLILNRSTGEILSADSLEPETNINVYYAQNKPMPMIYPATIIPDIIIVHDDQIGQVKVAKFDSDLVSLDKELKLQIAEGTIMVNEQGEELSEPELSDKELIVFYSVTTRSIPAQTTPAKIIVMTSSS